MKCKYCGIDMLAVSHSSGICNGWWCMACGHEEIEAGSYALAGRPDDIDITCKCGHCHVVLYNELVKKGRTISVDLLDTETKDECLYWISQSDEIKMIKKQGGIDYAIIK